jgi:hypothetical protein
MRKFILFFLLVILFVFFAKKADSQTNCIEKGKSIIEVYYGLPNFYPTIIKQGYNNNFDLTRGLRPDYKIRNFNPIGLKYERMMTNEIGIGLNIFYAKSLIEWDDATYKYKSNITRLRIAFSYYYHFATSPKFDPYFIAHIGYSHINYSFEQQSKIDSIPIIHPTPDIKFKFPLIFRAGIGVRYFVSKNFGFHAEAGIGGVLLAAGLSYKL